MDEYSITKQQSRIAQADRLFRFAQWRADDPRWYGPGHIGREFRPRHAMLTMHLWFLHKRLVMDTQNPHTSLLIQEELFDLFWDDTQKRIREQGVTELSVLKHLESVQQYTFQHMTHYDHAFTDFELNPKARFEELCGIVWIHILQREQENYCADQIQRLACYILLQHDNIMNQLPEPYWQEGRLAWVDIPDFTKLKDNKGNLMPEVPVPSVADDNANNNSIGVLPKGWRKALANTGEPFYWNPDERLSQWERPGLKSKDNDTIAASEAATATVKPS